MGKVPNLVAPSVTRAKDDTVMDSRADPSPPIPGGVNYWHGQATGSWWAMIPGRLGPRLVEAASKEHLAESVAWYLRMANL